MIMFIKGSRYRSLPESSPIDSAGERLRGKDLRLIPPTSGQFLHSVREGDRLDLVAFKYYGDATKWWQIADASPASPFPSDLLDRRPVTHERFVLRHSGFESRFRNLVIALAQVAQVATASVSSFDGSKPAEPSFLETTLVVTYPSSLSKHADIVGHIRAIDVGFHFLRSFSWLLGVDTAEAVSFDDPRARDDWRAVVETLSASAGVLELKSIVTEAMLDVSYNIGTIRRETVLSIIALNGFSVQPESVAVSSVGGSIVIPPNQIV